MNSEILNKLNALEELMETVQTQLTGRLEGIENERQANKIKSLKKQITYLNDCLNKKNIALDAMHWVWCNGGCHSGVHRYVPDEVTEEIVVLAENNAKRLRTWFSNAEFKKKWALMSQEDRSAWFAERQMSMKPDKNKVE